MKRLFDFTFSFLGLILLSPFLVLISILIKKDSTGPIFYYQERIGFQGTPFRLIKFRTMFIDKQNKNVQLTHSNDIRVTRFGSFLRKHKIDELPQLINVFVGEMSLVGPRPEVPKYIKNYSVEERKEVLSVKPGITDNASIVFREESNILVNSKNIEKTYINKILPIKISMYRKYVRERSFYKDIIIILKTFFYILFRK